MQQYYAIGTEVWLLKSMTLGRIAQRREDGSYVVKTIRTGRRHTATAAALCPVDDLQGLREHADRLRTAA